MIEVIRKDEGTTEDAQDIKELIVKEIWRLGGFELHVNDQGLFRHGGHGNPKMFLTMGLIGKILYQKDLAYIGASEDYNLIIRLGLKGTWSTVLEELSYIDRFEIGDL